MYLTLHRIIKEISVKKMDSPNTVYVIGEIPSKEVFDEFFSDPSFHEHMENIGVILPVDVTVLEEI